MKKAEDSIGLGGAAATTKMAVPPAPPPLPRAWVFRKRVMESVTNQEIAEFWRRKRVEEEDHLLAAIKAAACVRARNLSEEDYKCFVESLDDKDRDTMEEEEKNDAANQSNKDDRNKEIRIGIKDWWTKSKYAYLNQPAIGSNDPPKPRASTYVPNCFSFKPSTPLYPTSLGVF